jgi:hypothetical protein
MVSFGLMTEAFDSERPWSNKTIRRVSIDMNQASGGSGSA